MNICLDKLMEVYKHITNNQKLTQAAYILGGS
jgi:hypothetical protein